MEKSAEEAKIPKEVAENGRNLLEEMRRFATVLRCRHATLSAYFGEPYPKDNCGACDYCLGELEGIADATVMAQKVLSCVARVEQRFGVEHVVDVLTGVESERVRKWGHDKLSTHALLRDMPRASVTNLIYQLLDEGVLERTDGDRPVLKLNAASWEVMRGRRSVRLLEAKKPKAARTAMEEKSWSEVDEELFERLRALRRRIAAERGVPAYVIMHDSTMRELARIRPSTLDDLKTVRGLGDRKVADFGLRIVDVIASAAPGK